MELIKHRVTHYWSHRADGFEVQRLREFESEKKERWLMEFRKYLPQGKPLRVLDIGTGTGFFACILAGQDMVRGRNGKLEPNRLDGETAVRNWNGKGFRRDVTIVRIPRKADEEGKRTVNGLERFDPLKLFGV